MRFRNIHERSLPVAAAELGALLDTLAGDDDQLWPWEAWPAQRFDRPLGPGARGGHGPIRYAVEAYEPGCRILYRIDPRTGFGGTHEFVVEGSGDGRGAAIRHVVHGEGGLAGWLRWHLLIRWLHDALIEDAFDKAELATTGRVRRPARWSTYVRLWRRLLARMPRRNAEA